MIYIKGRGGEGSTHFYFFKPGSQRVLRAASYSSTPTCTTAGKQASEGFNGILPEAVLLRCRLFLLPLQLTPFTVSCPLPFLPPLPPPPNNAPNYSLHLVFMAQCGQIRRSPTGPDEPGIEVKSHCAILNWGLKGKGGKMKGLNQCHWGTLPPS